MKKICLFLILLVSCFYVSVNAQDYSIGTLIPVNTNASVHTEKFDYNFVYNSNVDEKGNSLLSFQSIKNNTMSKIPVSINLLLFDQNQKNIGYLTYCSNKDVSSNYAGFKLVGGQTVPFSINVVSKYFVSGKSTRDVKYVAVKDENKYCQVGGYDKYSGMTVDQIINNIPKNDGNGGFKLFAFLQDSENQKIIIIILVSVFALLIFGFILNTLYKRMYGNTTPLAYIPIINFYICSKLAFGNIVGLILGLLYVITAILYYLHIEFLLYISLVCIVVSFLLDLIKLITKKYNLLYIEPKIQAVTYQESNDNNNIENVQNTDLDSEQPILDLSYQNVDETNGFTSEGESSSNDELFNSINEGSNDIDQSDEVFHDIGNNSNDDNNNDNNNNSVSNSSKDEGESDLSKYFQ